ncbi:MAG: septum formation protein Maf [Chloroflexi bacterium]|nr:MAG: septum formation protein Maf [Chloroflexota bacterium]
MTPFILASSSPRRRDLLTSLGVEFSIIKPQIDEGRLAGEAPLDYVRRLSREKAAIVAAQLSDSSVILAADTIVVLAADTIGIETDGAILGKPVDADDARAILRRLRGRVHHVCTALTMLKTGDDAQQLTEHICTAVTMRNYSDDEIESYIATGDPFDKAGAYAIQHPGFRPVASIDTCYTNVVGMPLCVLKRMLAQIKWPGITAPPVCDCPSIS